MTQGSVLGRIVSFSLPYLLAYLLQILYGLADLFIIGIFCGVESTTAVSIGSQVMHMLTVMIVGLAMGTTVVIARAVGARDEAKAASAVGNTISLFMVLALALAAILLLLAGPIVSAMSTPAEAVSRTRDYLTICFAGIPFITAYNIIASIYRGMGDSRSPMIFVAVACVLNIVLDLVFIGALGMDASGAALGTTLSQTFSVLFALWHIRTRGFGVRLTRGSLRPRREVMGKILSIGVPVSLQDGFIQIAFLVITVIANRRGLDDAAAVGIVEKVIGLLFLVPSAMLSTVSTLSAQNIGAGLHDRARRTLRDALAITVGFGVVAAVSMQLLSEQTVSLFTSSPEVTRLGGQYLRSYVWDCILAGVHFCFSGFFCAYGLSIVSFIHNLASIVLARVPLSWLLSAASPDSLFPMGLAAPAGSLLSIIICLGFFAAFRRRGLIGQP